MKKSNHNSSKKSSYRGQFGYRNRGNRTGLDPVDSYAEVGYAEGLFIRNLFTGRLRTRNPILLIILDILGLAFCCPLLIYINYVIGTGTLFSSGLICVIPMTGIGLMFFLNVFRSLEPRSTSRKKRRNKDRHS